MSSLASEASLPHLLLLLLLLLSLPGLFGFWCCFLAAAYRRSPMCQ
jgi:hypothetical protein